MRADNTAHLIAAAGRRHELARSKAIRAIRELDAAAVTVTFESVARAAGVSRSWLYTQPDIREEVLRLRDLGRRAPGTSLPAHHRSSDASLLRRLQARHARWPATANPHLLINLNTAGGLEPVGRGFIHAAVHELGITAQDLRADRLHDEARASGGDPLRLAHLFGISDAAAIRYCAELEVDDNGPEGC